MTFFMGRRKTVSSFLYHIRTVGRAREYHYEKLPVLDTGAYILRAARVRRVSKLPRV